MMTDKPDIVANNNERCTCAEAYGENPRCVQHGTATAWALENTTPDEWQNQALDQMETVAMMDRQVATLRADLANARQWASEQHACADRYAAQLPEARDAFRKYGGHRFCPVLLNAVDYACTCGYSAALAKLS